MKQLFKLFPVMLMVAAISVAGCGDKKKDDDKKGGDTASDKKDDSASNTMPSPTMVATKVSLPKMDWA